MLRLVLFVLSFSVCVCAEAADSPPGPPGARDHRPFGVNLSGISGSPFAAELGVNFAYNPVSFGRIQIGLGYEADRVTWGGGFKLFHPDWDFSPTVGLSGSEHSNFGVTAAWSVGIDFLDRESGVSFGCGWNSGIRSARPGGLELTVGWFW